MQFDHLSGCFDTYDIFSVSIKLLKEPRVSLCSVFFRFDNLKSKVNLKVT